MEVNQSSLFDVGWGELQEPDYGSGDTIQERFAAFNTANPWVLDALIALTEDMKRSGRSKVGMKMLFEVLRWSWYRRTTSGDFKLNNNYTSRYARLIAVMRPDLAPMFEVRVLTSD